MRRADVAMYVAKGERTGIEVYDAARDPNSPTRLGTVAALRDALDNAELELHYQPKVSLADGTVVGVEALVRWRHPERGLLQPDEFIPLAERTGLIHRLTEYVLDRGARPGAACGGASGCTCRWPSTSRCATCRSPTSPAVVVAELDAQGLPAAAIMLEVTESVLVPGPGPGRRHAARARATSASRSSLDDFGTGYSSLLLLEQLPVAEIKIDRSFVRRLDESGGDPAMVRSIVAFAHGLGLSVVAEGVESSLAWKVLRDMELRRRPGLPRRAAHAGDAGHPVARRARRPRPVRAHRPARSSAAARASPTD